MGLKPEERQWLKLFRKVVTGRASREECDSLGVREELRSELYNARYARRHDASRKVIPKFKVREGWGDCDPEDPIDAMIELIDRKNKANRK